jgi:hypothetical protein
VIARPYLVSQEFGDGAFRDHLIKEIGKVAELAGGFFPAPLSWQLEARPIVLTRPFTGRKYMSYLVRPPGGPRTPADKLMATFGFTTRPGVTVRLFDETSDDAVRVWIEMDADKYVPFELPRRSDWDLSIDDLDRLYHGLGNWIYTSLIGLVGNLLGSPFPWWSAEVALILNRGIRTDRYDAPRSPAYPWTTVHADQLKDAEQFVEDVNQPWPLAGRLEVFWESAKEEQTQTECDRLCTQLGFAESRVQALEDSISQVPDKAAILRQIRAWENRAAKLRIEIQAAGCEC